MTSLVLMTSENPAAVIPCLRHVLDMFEAHSALSRLLMTVDAGVWSQCCSVPLLTGRNVWRHGQTLVT